MSLRDTGKFISLILRHKPDAIGITLSGVIFHIITSSKKTPVGVFFIA